LESLGFSFCPSEGNFCVALTSDIDLIVELQPRPPVEYGGALIDLGIDLGALFERKVDLLSDQPIKNIIFKRVVERTKQLIYDQKSTTFAFAFG
jgi:hypothetical protein